MLNVTPIMVWVERRGSALIQDRPGPNRVGPFGLFQSFADALKFILKEDIIPAQAHKWLYTLAPMFGLIPALTTIAVVPWGRPFLLPEADLGHALRGGAVRSDRANVNIGILLIFALASMGVYGIVMAGWASANKYSLFGGIRASAQMISYELSLTLAAVSVLMAAGSLSLTDVVWQQTGSSSSSTSIKLPAWNIFSPAMWIGFIVFFVSAFAETNRLPFDFAEAEAELVAGYHTEYSSMKFALFFMSEYMAMATMSALITTLFLGGWDIPWYNEPPNALGFAAVGDRVHGQSQRAALRLRLGALDDPAAQVRPADEARLEGVPAAGGAQHRDRGVVHREEVDLTMISTSPSSSSSPPSP